MKRLSIKETVRLHKILWGYLAETGKTKSLAFKTVKELIGLDIDADCFACEQAWQKRNDCDKCIFVWGKDTKEGAIFECCFGGSPFDIWEEAKTTKTRKKYAAIIRDLPLKKQYQRYLK